jgi:type I restriction enzyme S subunit/type I restriction enzyme M protein
MTLSTKLPALSAQQEIRRLILEARKLRDSSANLLAVAKRAVEMAIEQDEAEALRYLEQQKENR